MTTTRGLTRASKKLLRAMYKEYDIHKMVRKEYWLEAEEWLCNYLTDYGIYIFEAFFEVLGPSALNAIPKQFDILLGAA